MMVYIIFLFLFLLKTSCCFYSSFLFLLNIFYSILYKNYIYAFLFINLLTTSIYFHLYSDGFILDQIVILLLVLYGTSLVITKRKKILHLIVILSTFSLIVHFFYYGYLTKSYCYGTYGKQFHSLLHLLTSIGHLAILFM